MEQEYNFHIPVMLKEVLEFANLHEDSIVVDMTLGRAGHSCEFLKIIRKGFLYGVDRDETAIDYSKQKLAEIGTNFKIMHSEFTAAPNMLRSIGVPKADFIFYDLGVSSPQFDDPGRGFSYRFDSKLDMRMNQHDENTATACDIVNGASPDVLIHALMEYADESYARPIVRNIINHRNIKPIETTFELVNIIKEVLPARELRKPGHPAKKTFMGIRYLVNNEKDEIVRGIPEGLKFLKVGGRLAVLTFNSFEDGLVKNIFREYTAKPVVDKYLPPIEYTIDYKLVTRKPLVPTAEEVSVNNRSKPAKIRVIERIK